MNPDQKRYALIAGLSLLSMSVLAPVAAFVFLGNPRGLPATVLGARLGGAVLIFLAIAILDIIVALALHRLISLAESAGEGGSTLSLAVAVLRITYAICLILALTPLAGAQGQIALGAGPEIGKDAIAAFRTSWSIGLGIFGLHLLGLGLILGKTRLVPWVLGILVSLAGLAYLADTILPLAGIRGVPNLASYLFIGEMLLMVWLIAKAFTKPRKSTM